MIGWGWVEVSCWDIIKSVFEYTKILVKFLKRG